MKIHKLSYLFREGIRNFALNKLMSFSCVGVLLALFLLVGSSYILNVTVNNLVTVVENQNEIVVFLKDNVSDEEVSSIKKWLESMADIKKVTYVSKEQALQNEKKKAGDFAEIFDGLERDNPLPASFVASLESIEHIDTLSNAIGVQQSVEKVMAQTDVASVVLSVKRIIQSGGNTIVALLVIVSIIIISNTIKLTVFSRKAEIRIMRYVGATYSYITFPFIIEGFMIGLIASVTAFFAMWAGYNYLYDSLLSGYATQFSAIISSMPLFRELAKPLLYIFFGIGVPLGGLSSGFFVRRHIPK